MQNIELRYAPFLSQNGEVSEDQFTRYCEENGLGELVTRLVIDPIEERLKAHEEKEIKVGEITLSRTEKSGTSTQWKPALEGLAGFIDLRADDAQAKTIEGLEYREGVGYCIAVDEWGRQIEKQIKANTTATESVSIGWPSFGKKENPARRIEIPYNGLRTLSEQTIKTVIAARNFRASLKRELIDPFKEANERWHARETGYDNKGKIPPKDESPIPRARKIADGKYVLIQLVQVESVDYKEIIETLQEEQEQLGGGEAVGGYRTTNIKGRPFTNINMIQARMATLRESAITIKARYEIIP